MPIEVVTPPIALPVTADYAREHSRIDFDDDNNYLTSKIREAVEFIQWWTGRQIMSATLKQIAEGFPCGGRDLGIESRPVSAISFVKYYDTAGEQQTLDSDGYWAAIAGDYPYLRPRTSWPATQSGRPQAVEIQFIAGYANADAVPERLKAAVLLYVAMRYEIREPVVINQYAREVPYGLEDLCESLSAGGYA